MFLNGVKAYIPDENLEISQVLKPNIFTEEINGFFDYGYFHTDVWLKFPINIQDNSTHTVEYYQHFTEELQLFVLKNNQTVFVSKPTGTKYYKQGDYTQVSEINTSRFSFNLPKGSYTGYIKIHSPYSPVRGAIKLWSKETYKPIKKYYTQKKGFWNVAFGFTLFTVFIAVVFYFFTKKRIYLLYALYMVTAIVNMYLTRGFTEGVLDKLSFLRYDLRSYLNIIYIVVTLSYFYYLIPLNYRNKWTSVLIKYTGIYIVVFTLIGSLLPVDIKTWHFIIVSLKPAMFVTIIVCFFHLWFAFKKGYGIAKIYLIAYVTLFLTIAIHLLQILKIIEWTVDLSILIWESSLFLELLIFAFAFVYQYHQTSMDNVALQKEININQKKYLSDYIEAQENERIKIARELHDGIVQQLGSVILKLRNKEHRELIANELENVNHQLRNVSHQMIPASLGPLGLFVALEDLLNNVLKLNGIEYDFDVYHFTERLPQNIEHHLYRICQELLQNIVKYSKCNYVSITFIKNENQIVLRIEDNGVGFDTQISNLGLGLQNIKERILILNGTFDIESTPNMGVISTIKLPMND